VIRRRVRGERLLADPWDETAQLTVAVHPSFERLNDAFYARVLKDDLLAPLFTRMPPEHDDGADEAGHPEFRAAFLGYIKWGTRHNSQPGADVAGEAPVPHWGWGVARPYRP
jgi:hemoglobin